MREDSAESNASSQRRAELKDKNIKTTNKKRIEYTNWTNHLDVFKNVSVLSCKFAIFD